MPVTIYYKKENKKSNAKIDSYVYYGTDSFVSHTVSDNILKIIDDPIANQYEQYQYLSCRRGVKNCSGYSQPYNYF